MPLDDAGMRRAGLGFIYRITPVLVATLLYGNIYRLWLLFFWLANKLNTGIYIAILCIATRGLMSVKYL